MPDSQNDEASSIETLFCMELTIHDHNGRETQYTLHKLPVIIG